MVYSPIFASERGFDSSCFTKHNRTEIVIRLTFMMMYFVLTVCVSVRINLANDFEEISRFILYYLLINGAFSFYIVLFRWDFSNS